MPTKKTIALDMDEVIADVTPKFVEIYEEIFGRKLAKSEYYGKKIYEIEGAAEVRARLYEKGFFRHLPIVEGSQEAVQELMKHYDIYITTAAQEFRNSLEDKYDWLADHFPFIHWKQFVFCGDKSILGTDYMIDDHARNLRTFKGKGLLFTASHNINETEFTRVNNWQEVIDFFAAERMKGTRK